MSLVAPRLPTSDFGRGLSRASILAIDEDPVMRDFMAKTFGPRVRRCVQVSTFEEAEKRIEEARFDIIILNLASSRASGLSWINENCSLVKDASIILTTNQVDLGTAMAALRAGARDILKTPFRADQILVAAARLLDRSSFQSSQTPTQSKQNVENEPPSLKGRSAAFNEVRVMLETLAPLSTPVLFTGATGTGKEMAARSLHALSGRAARPFVVVNFGTIPPERTALELFGTMVPGETETPGLLAKAGNGTLLIDDVTQMSEAVQAALLRVLETQSVRPVGAERYTPVDLRFCFATNDNLEQAVSEGRLRADLYHRMTVVTVPMPMLKDRQEDITELAAYFLDEFAGKMKQPAPELTADVLLKMHRYDWPGNVRELRNVMERSVIMGAFPEEFSGVSDTTDVSAMESLDLVVQRHILNVLDRCGGNRAEAARRLGVSRKTIDRKYASWFDQK